MVISGFQRSCKSRRMEVSGVLVIDEVFGTSWK